MKKYFINFLFFILICLVSFGSGIGIAQIKLEYFTENKAQVILLQTTNPPTPDSNASTEREISQNIPAAAMINDVQSVEGQNTIEGKINNTKIKSDEDSFSFAVLGDTQSFGDSGNLQKAVNSINNQNVDVVMTVGDLINKCSEASACQGSYNNWKNIMSPLISKTYEVVGNHDRTGGALSDEVWQKEFSDLPSNGPADFAKQVYSFDYQNSHFVVLDSEKPHRSEIGAEERAWLEQDLTTHSNAHTFVFYHEPAFKTSTHKAGFSLDSNPKERDAFWKILAKHNVTAVFNGHEHIYTRKKIGNIYQFTVGDTDSPLEFSPDSKLSDYAYKGNFYAKVTVSGAKINVSLYSVDGKLINSFDLT